MIDRISICSIFILLCLVSNSRAFTSEDKQKFMQQYLLKTGENTTWHEELCMLHPKFFQGLFESTLFNRISGFKQFLGAGSGGFVFLADYIAPDDLTNTKNQVAIKIIPDNGKRSSFDDNMILAVLTGNLDKDKFDQSKTRPFSYDKSEDRIQSNEGGNRNLYSARINKFYEMQYNTIHYVNSRSQQKKQSASVLVTRAGISDLSSSIFANINDKEANTIQLVNLFGEMAEGSRNINKQNILHGDIKGANMIINVDNQNNLHVEYIDFDLILNPEDDSEYFNHPLTKDEYKINPGFDHWFSIQVRYTVGYRAPWVVGYNAKKKSDQSKSKTFYPYDKNFKEDTYAVAATIQKVFAKNRNYLDLDNLALNNILGYTKQMILDQAVNGPNNVPTTAEMYTEISKIIVNGIDKKIQKIFLDTPKMQKQSSAIFNPEIQNFKMKKTLNTYKVAHAAIPVDQRIQMTNQQINQRMQKVLGGNVYFIKYTYDVIYIAN